MPSLQIRDLPPDVYEALSFRARRQGRSLAQQALADLRRVSELERRERRLEILEALKARIERDGIRELSRSPEELIREDRRR